jgi:hypothetical protein
MNWQRDTKHCLLFQGKRVYERVDQAHKLIYGHKRIVRVYYSPLFYSVLETQRIILV